MNVCDVRWRWCGQTFVTDFACCLVYGSLSQQKWSSNWHSQSVIQSANCDRLRHWLRHFSHICPADTNRHWWPISLFFDAWFIWISTLSIFFSSQLTRIQYFFFYFAVPKSLYIHIKFDLSGWMETTTPTTYPIEIDRSFLLFDSYEKPTQ